ncbi:MAG: hypothetical protein K5931_01515 [Lachnospiraceae bacterium]|nr:hypothetical protein [Lachnospiraceae bacterium]
MPFNSKDNKLSDDMLENVNGGNVFYAGNISGADMSKPFEVINDVTGDVVERHSNLEQAIQGARSYGISPDLINWDNLQDKRNKYKK